MAQPKLKPQFCVFCGSTSIPHPKNNQWMCCSSKDCGEMFLIYISDNNSNFKVIHQPTHNSPEYDVNL